MRRNAHRCGAMSRDQKFTRYSHGAYSPEKSHGTSSPFVAQAANVCGLRMADMRTFVFAIRATLVILHSSLLATGCPSSQIAIVTLAAVPLWKVMVGPAPTNSNRTRKGPVFLFFIFGRGVKHIRMCCALSQRGQVAYGCTMLNDRRCGAAG